MNFLGGKRLAVSGVQMEAKKRFFLGLCSLSRVLNDRKDTIWNVDTR